MYEVYILTQGDWYLYKTANNLKELDCIVYELTTIYPNTPIQIIQDGIELDCLDGSEYQYWYFKNRYVRGRSLTFDYVKSYVRKEDKHGN